MNTWPSSQYVLNLTPRLDARLSDFAGPSWATLLAAIHALLDGRSERCLMYGEADTGKTHLLAAACGASSARGESTLLLSLRELLASHDPDALQSLENYHLIALDDLDALQGHGEWEEALFHFLNRAQQNHTRILLAARAAPGQLGLQLPDLASRLSQAACFRLPDGDDDRDRHALLQAALDRRALHLDDDIVDYLVSRGPRCTGLLLRHLGHLEETALQQRKKLTLHFVKQLTES